jgi:hypothetical protein
VREARRGLLFSRLAFGIEHFGFHLAFSIWRFGFRVSRKGKG